MLANFENIIKKINLLKEKSTFLVGNLYYDASALHAILDEKKCLIFSNDECIFLLVPFHTKWYNLLFTSVSLEALRNFTKQFLSNYASGTMIRVSIVGLHSKVEELASLFGDYGFAIQKRIARFRLPQQNSGKKDVNFLVSSPTVSNESPFAKKTFFAEIGEEKKILGLLMEEFDCSAYNLPEPEEIVENIKKQQVIVIKDNENIIACHYFEIKNGIYYGLYDVVKKEYRKNFLFGEILNFLTKHLSSKNIKVSRSYGWRDVDNKRLMRFAKMMNQKQDGVYIYNMSFKPIDKTPK